MTSGCVPSAFRERIDESYRSNLYNQIRYADEFFRIRELLGNEGITIVPFKGFWLASEAYGNIADRESLDVDVFVNEADLAGIKDVMLRAGYVEEHTYRRLTIEEIKKGFQEYNFDREEGGVNVFHIEFHWGICPPEYGMGIRLGDLSDKVTRGTFQGRELDVFTPSAQLLLSVLHHGGKDRFVLLKQVNDIAMFMRNCRETEWDRLQGEMRRYHAESLLYTALHLAWVITGTGVPPEVKDMVFSGRIRRLAGNRLRLMSKAPRSYHTAWFNVNNWIFRLRTRNGLRTSVALTVATARAVVLRRKRR
jgi:hypothetical protein